MMRHSPRHSSSPSRTARTEPPSASLWSAIRKGCYPHQLSWLIDNPLRRLIIRPETLADRLPLTPSSRILELGPGSGYFSAELARRIPAGRLELLDLQPQMLAKARRRLDRLACSNVGYTAADACRQLPYEEASFDLVLLVAILGELPDPEAALAGLQRLLRPRGHSRCPRASSGSGLRRCRPAAAARRAARLPVQAPLGARLELHSMFRKALISRTRAVSLLRSA